MLETPLVIDAPSQLLAEKIRTRGARVGIVGLGYVGLPLAVEFAKAGFTVTGIDVDAEKVRRVNAGDSYVSDIPRAILAPLVDAGKPKFQTANIPKVVGGCTAACTEMGRLFYAQALQHVVPVSGTQVAEMVKLLENTFRMINIGLVNEIALMCDRMQINVWEVIDAAATKPFGFMPFYPGPGLGGHCIPIDPFYLSWKTKQAGIEARFIELAGH